MADILDKLHVDAAMTRLYADAELTVYPNEDGLTPDNPALPYVRVYAVIDRPADAEGNSLAGVSAQWTVRWYVHCIAANEPGADAIRMRVRAALLDVRPSIPGRDCGLIRQGESYPPNPDDSTGSRVYDALVVYKLITT